MNFTRKYFLLLSCCLLMMVQHTAMAQLTWKNMAPGIEYTTIKGTSSGTIHAFKINLRFNKLDLALALDHSVSGATVKTLVEKNHALLGINGGFFTPEFEPIGLRIQKGIVKSKMKPISWWGVFYISKNSANLVSEKNYNLATRADFAVQGGPRLIVNGTVPPKLKSGTDERSAVGITKDGKVILAITENNPLETANFAKILLSPESQDGLACYNALNLDGGTSSQLYAQIGDFALNIPGYKFVTDAVLVKPL